MFTNKMICQIDEYMLYCQSKQLSEKTIESYEQTLHLFERWCGEEMLIENVTEITEGFIRRYINDLQTRGKYMVCCNDGTKKINCPERRRDFRQPVSVTTIKDYDKVENIIWYKPQAASISLLCKQQKLCVAVHRSGQLWECMAEAGVPLYWR